MVNSKLSQTQTLLIEGQVYPIYLSEIPEQWHLAAQERGVQIAARICDRYHLALRCNRCGDLTKTKIFVLTTCKPTCGPCLTTRHESLARMAGMTFLYRDSETHKWAFYRAPCGHPVRRQFGFVKRMALGEVNVRCDICHGRLEGNQDQGPRTGSGGHGHRPWQDLARSF
jgi:hypothetical protein